MNFSQRRQVDVSKWKMRCEVRRKDWKIKKPSQIRTLPIGKLHKLWATIVHVSRANFRVERSSMLQWYQDMFCIVSIGCIVLLCVLSIWQLGGVASLHEWWEWTSERRAWNTSSENEGWHSMDLPKECMYRVGRKKLCVLNLFTNKIGAWNLRHYLDYNETHFILWESVQKFLYSDEFTEKG